MKLPPKLLGKLGELRALAFYLLRGYRVIGRNVRMAKGEIDLVVQRGRTIAVVEVKTRQSLTAGEGYEAVTRTKRERLVRLGEHYASRGAQLRYDILSLFWTGWWFAVSPYADAFRPVADVRYPWQWRA